MTHNEFLQSLIRQTGTSSAEEAGWILLVLAGIVSDR